MGRPIPWLFRLHEIRQSAGQSPRSHYTRKELQSLFEVQRSSAARLLEVLPTTKVGTAHLVSKEHLTKFLDRAKDSDDVPGLMDEMRREKAQQGVSRKKIRSLVARDVAEASFDALPASLKIEQGKLEITFSSMEEMVRALLTVATLLQDELDEFARRYEPQPEPEAPDKGIAEMQEMFAELEKMERERGIKAATTPEHQGQPQ